MARCAQPERRRGPLRGSCHGRQARARATFRSMAGLPLLKLDQAGAKGARSHATARPGSRSRAECRSGGPHRACSRELLQQHRGGLRTSASPRSSKGATPRRWQPSARWLLPQRTQTFPLRWWRYSAISTRSSGEQSHRRASEPLIVEGRGTGGNPGACNALTQTPTPKMNALAPTRMTTRSTLMPRTTSGRHLAEQTEHFVTEVSRTHWCPRTLRSGSEASRQRPGSQREANVRSRAAFAPAMACREPGPGWCACSKKISLPQNANQSAQNHDDECLQHKHEHEHRHARH